MEELKRLLIVDDSEIDREVLKSILKDDFEIMEADNGYSALQIILEEKEILDAILLDVSMPFLDGLDVLRILRENELGDIHVFMISSEATKDNIEKASHYQIDEFIRKPFDRDEILKRVRANLGVKAKAGLTKRDMDDIRIYIDDLKLLYKRYLHYSGRGSGYEERRSYFMKVMLEKTSIIDKNTESADFMIEIISKAAYFCNIGEMLLFGMLSDRKPENVGRGQYQQHTVLGADLIQLNYSRHCKQFVQICSDMCLHHHERFDGNGYPHGMKGDDISIYTQMCGLLERFDEEFFKYSRHNNVQFDYVINQLSRDNGFVSDKVFNLLLDSKEEIVKYYNLKHE